MILRIGLDFDNTIANYDLAFFKVAELLDLKTTATTKSEVKKICSVVKAEIFCGRRYKV